jgi:hypothetical protein
LIVAGRGDVFFEKKKKKKKKYYIFEYDPKASIVFASILILFAPRQRRALSRIDEG